MHIAIRDFLHFFLQYGPFGLALLAVADDSFLFLPVGMDLLMVILVARHHQQLAVDVLAAAAGSTVGVLLLDLICRKGGEEVLKRLVKPRLLAYLKQRMEKHGVAVLVIGCLSPPPFPFGACIATASALQFPRARLLGVVFCARAVRFALVGWAAIAFVRGILRIANSTGFLWFMGAFIAFCLVGSVLSILQWVRVGRAR